MPILIANSQRPFPQLVFHQLIEPSVFKKLPMEPPSGSVVTLTGWIARGVPEGTYTHAAFDLNPVGRAMPLTTEIMLTSVIVFP